jgi:hypothetical protein
MSDDDKTRDPSQDAADAVKQRGMDATVDLGKEPGEQQGIVPEQAPSKPRTEGEDGKGEDEEPNHAG